MKLIAESKTGKKVNTNTETTKDLVTLANYVRVLSTEVDKMYTDQAKVHSKEINRLKSTIQNLRTELEALNSLVKVLTKGANRSVEMEAYLNKEVSLRKAELLSFKEAHLRVDHKPWYKKLFG